jgi:succinate dehydrogenase cytochrome b subunit
MSSGKAAPAPSPLVGQAAFTRARLASALAIAPLGVWSVAHLWHNLAAFQGGDAWQHAVTEYSSPVAEAVTGLVVLLPLAVHTVWGLGRLLTTRPNNQRYRYFANLRYLLQRLSAVGLLLFLGAHLWLAMLRPRLRAGHAEDFADIAHEMHTHRPTLVVYVLGVLALAYHLANGVETFAMGWGIVGSRRALNGGVFKVSMAIFVVLLVMGWAGVYALYAAGT